MQTLPSVLPPAEMGTAQQEIPVATEELQHEGPLYLLDADYVFVIMEDNVGHTTIEGCYASERRAQLRLEVLLLKRELALAKAREEYPDHKLDHDNLSSPCYWLVTEKLIR